MRLAQRLVAATFLPGLFPPLAAASLPWFDHIVVVVEENHSDANIIGNPEAPYINTVAAEGANFTNSFALTHPSQPNYLNLFSGFDQGIVDAETPAEPFTTPNLGANLIAKGFTFGGYSESLPSVGFDGDTFSATPGFDEYVRRHNPWVNWQGSSANAIPVSANLPFSAFPTDFSLLPTVSFVVPNLQNDMHDGSIADGDTWLQANLGAYAQWALSNNSLLIVIWDEDDFTELNRIPTIFFGANVIPGSYSETINHYDVLRTIEDINGLDHAGNSATAVPITSVFVAVPEPDAWPILAVTLAAIAIHRRLRPSSPNETSART